MKFSSTVSFFIKGLVGGQKAILSGSQFSLSLNHLRACIKQDMEDDFEF